MKIPLKSEEEKLKKKRRTGLIRIIHLTNIFNANL